MVAYDTVRLQRWITSACLGNIARYTDREDYELIFVDQGNGGELNTRFNYIDIDKHIKVPENIGCSAAMNMGAKQATGDYICFIHNDVLVWEGWLDTLRGFIEKGTSSIIMPHQGASSRKDVKRFYKEECPSGNDDAGLILMTKEAFQKTGGWDERFKTIYMSAAFRMRFPEQYYCTAKCLITHICCGTLWAWTPEKENAAYDAEAKIFNNLREEKTKQNYL